MCRVGQACNAEEAAKERALFEQVASGNADMEYSTCRYVTVTAMYTRLLEGRVARLEARIAELEAAVEAQREVFNGNSNGHHECDLPGRSSPRYRAIMSDALSVRS